jgi:hypothetical protein
MSRGVLFDYTFEVIQEEECLIWDTVYTNPEKWLNEYCDEIVLWEVNGTWISRVIGKMTDTYKE